MMALLLNANDSVSRSYSITKPSPLHPIVPSGCGERTENLCYKIITNATIDGNGRIVYDASFDVAVAPVYQDSSYSSLNPSNVYAWFMAEPYLGSQSYNQSRNAEVLINKTSPLNGFVTVRYIKANSSNAMIVEGSTAPTSYIPYGYKLPLTVNGVEYPIYLGEVETTRKIKKLVLTGKENFSKNTTSSSNYLYYSLRNGLLPNSIGKTPLICNELPVINEAPVSQIGISSNNAFNVIYINFGADVMNTQPSGNTADGLKEYLAAQYAAGTPVTVWYVLAEPETGIVNEPLMKIGDYADTIDSTQANVQIPTVAGETTISWAGEGLAPSEFDSIAEWVNTPTYKRVNGEWVEDN